MSSTAARFSDEMNTRLVVKRQASDEQHATCLLVLLRLELADIRKRFMVGATDLRREVGSLAYGFVDGSVAVVSDGRWTPAIWGNDD